MPKDTTTNTPNTVDSVPDGVDFENVTATEGPPGSSDTIELEATGFKGGDYVPGPTKKLKIEAQKKGYRIDVNEPVNAQFGDIDYVDGKETAKKAEVFATRVKELAKKLKSDQDKALEKYREAEEIVSKATEEELKNPDRKLEKARNLVKTLKPRDRQAILDKAKEILLSKEYRE